MAIACNYEVVVCQSLHFAPQIVIGNKANLLHILAATHLRLQASASEKRDAGKPQANENLFKLPMKKRSNAHIGKVKPQKDMVNTKPIKPTP